jgi:DNA processing protein
MDEFLYLWALWGPLTRPRYEKVIEHFGNLEAAWKQITPAFLRSVLKIPPARAERLMAIKGQVDLKGFLEVIQRVEARLVFIEDSEYPERLKHIYDAPVFLWVRGKIPDLTHALGVVGTRKMTDYGQWVTEKITAGLIPYGFTIVSGMALGVDACAHEVTLNNGGKTIAVLGCGVDLLYPPANERLGERIIAEGGAVVSEYPPGTPAFSYHFPERNRIIAGLSQGVVVMEAGIKSGALITARSALEENRDVFAVPGDIRKPQLGGTNHLIKNTRAHLVESAEDIALFYGLKSVPSERKSIIFEDPDQEKVAQALLGGPRTLSQLEFSTGLGAQPLMVALGMLELKSFVRESGLAWVLT